ncbi:MAG: hypothetical protein WBO17_12875 [Sphingorhabdus sp.]
MRIMVDVEGTVAAALQVCNKKIADGAEAYYVARDQNRHGQTNG